MVTIERDYHGLTVDAALRDVIKLIVDDRDVKRFYRLKLITGQGEIKREIQNLLDDLEVNWDYQPNNPGCLLVYLDEDL